MRVRARHEPCGTLVSDEVPERYPVEEGAGLYCPVCAVAFWGPVEVVADEPEAAAEATPVEEPAPEPGPAPPPVEEPEPEPGPEPPPVQEPEPEPAPPPVQEPEPALAPPPPAAQETPPAPEPPVPAPSPDDTRASQPPPGPGRALADSSAASRDAVAASAPTLPPPRRGSSARAAVFLVALTAILVLVVVLLATGGDDPERARPAPTATAPTAAPPEDAGAGAEAEPQPAPEPVATPEARRVSRTLAGTSVSAVLPRDWALRRRGSRIVATNGDSEVTVSVAPRRGRSLAELGRDLRASLDAPRSATRPALLDRLPALQVRAGEREATVAALGSQRVIVARPAGAAAARRVARSVRVAPAR